MTNVKGKTANNIGYTGIVTISQYVKSKKIVLAQSHNEGGVALFNYLASCLAGDFSVAEVTRPSKIMLLNVDDTSGKARQITRARNAEFIPILAKPEQVYSAAEGIVRYSFIIPQDALAGTNFNAVGLYTATATYADFEDYAALSIINLDRSNLSLSSVLVLDWELHISNK